MPADSLYLNTKATPQNTYDAIVVGSGVSGGWAAKELCEKGLRVLLLERGGPMQHPSYPTALMHPWEFEHRNSLSQEDRKKYPVQTRHYSINEDNKHFYVKDLENPYEEIQRYDWIRADVVGGRSLLWARACYRWSDLDFEANLKDGHGIDWPIRYKDLAPWYDYVEAFAGISGNRDGIPHLPDGIFQPPFEMNCVEKDFTKKIASTYKSRQVIIGRSANLTAPLKGRGVCQSRNLCHRGCPFGAYFSSNSSTLPAALATGRLTIRPYSLVNNVVFDNDSQRAKGVEVIDTNTKKTEVFYSTILFINAATIGTTAILLNSVSNRFPNGMGNDSGQLGLNMMDHHKGLVISADVEGYEDSYYTGRRPTNIYIPRFRNATENTSDFLRGYHFGGGAHRQRNMAEGIGATYKTALTEAGPWKISLYHFGECLPYSDNKMSLHPDKKDPFGRPLISFDVRFRENEFRMFEDAAKTGSELLEAGGYKNIKVSGKISFPGNANHEMGTARMGHDPKTSVLNAFNQLHSVKNVFVTDGACMTSGSCVNPSITYMALTARACDYAVKELKKGSL
ncbi:GMC family oxidoreductase [Flavihumibacter sp. CACIAM 22H1]|uniref:GMC oxidoreductase n=1 Tax=Flavihumibacter sp. CACIAM 22H1 TaxID=1812911 RepID=UPI0007A8931D|nr:GMC family oxidoreductase [Flavihumibacter sp. CACIAM 22H1]KYP16305.1 MAG: GMC family oxidoreductase [Flavihumibacter sp. CACIAM 22H1]